MVAEERRLRLKVPRPLWLGVVAALLILLAVVLPVWLPYARAQKTAALLRDAGFDVSLERRGPEWLSDWLASNPRLDDLLGELLETEFSSILLVAAEEAEALEKRDLSLLRRVDDLTFLGLMGLQVGDRDFEHFRHLQSLEALILSGVSFTDRSISLISEFKHLETLGLVDCDFKNVRQPLNLPELNYLDLGGVNVRNEDLARLSDLVRISDLPKLTMLFLSDTSITDDGLVHLQQLDQLRVITFSGTPITDEGLMHLTSLKSLTDIVAWNTHITKEGARRFVEAVPRAVVNLGDDGTVRGADYEK